MSIFQNVYCYCIVYHIALYCIVLYCRKHTELFFVLENGLYKAFCYYFKSTQAKLTFPRFERAL